MATVDEVSEMTDRLYRSEFRRLFATLVKILKDFDLAEESLHEAFAAALAQWPDRGIPKNPCAWLVSVARFRAIDIIRHRASFDVVAEEFISRIDALPSVHDGEEIEDDRLRLIFVCCHPALSPEAQVALTLREVCGLTTEEIASAYLVPSTTLAQRIVRAKARIREERIPFEIPAAEDLSTRLSAVLQVIYLIFNEGYFASSGSTHIRADLSLEAVRLGRLLVALLPDPEVYGLLALMLLHLSRSAARIAEEDEIVPLDQQDRTLWDPALIDEGLRLANLAFATVDPGPYALQAAISATHASASDFSSTDWPQIVKCYDRLLELQPSPVLALNRAVAIAMWRGPSEGLRIVDAMLARGELSRYHLAHAARADFCRRLGRLGEARVSYQQALDLASQEPERRFLRQKLDELS